MSLKDKKESPVEPFKQAITLAVRCIADDPELTVTFGTEPPGLRGGRVRLPLPSRNLPPQEVALVRGHADAYALRLAHHNVEIHARRLPSGENARQIFEAAEQARVEAIGALQMKGMGANLSNLVSKRCKDRGFENLADPHQAPLAEIVGLFVREKLTGAPPPENARDIVEAWRPIMEQKAGPDLDLLVDNIDAQNAFANITRNIIADLDLGDELGDEDGDQDDDADDMDAQEGDDADSESTDASSTEQTEMAEGESEDGDEQMVEMDSDDLPD